MKCAAAKNLLRENINEMSLEKVQRFKIKVLDAWRESKAEYGFEQAINNGFYQIIIDEYSSGYTPKDMWLTKNLETIYDMACERERELLNS